jgi:hypothetical protein
MAFPGFQSFYGYICFSCLNFHYILAFGAVASFWLGFSPCLAFNVSDSCLQEHSVTAAVGSHPTCWRFLIQGHQGQARAPQGRASTVSVPRVAEDVDILTLQPGPVKRPLLQCNSFYGRSLRHGIPKRFPMAWAPEDVVLDVTEI